MILPSSLVPSVSELLSKFVLLYRTRKVFLKVVSFINPHFGVDRRFFAGHMRYIETTESRS